MRFLDGEQMGDVAVGVDLFETPAGCGWSTTERAG
jgi:hypothetical protein